MGRLLCDFAGFTGLLWKVIGCLAIFGPGRQVAKQQVLLQQQEERIQQKV
jgi:hypothetical protein